MHEITLLGRSHLFIYRQSKSDLRTHTNKDFMHVQNKGVAQATLRNIHWQNPANLCEDACAIILVHRLTWILMHFNA